MTKTAATFAPVTIETILNIVRADFYMHKYVLDNQSTIVEFINDRLEEGNDKDMNPETYEIYHAITRKLAKDARDQEQTIKYAGITPHASATIEIGTILYASWGYEQTNIDFYCVVEVKGSMCKLLPLNQVLTEESRGDHGKTRPTQIDFTAEILRRKVQTTKYDNTQYIKIEDYSRARIWDGKDKYTSWGY